jgi:hypothetical protein
MYGIERNRGERGCESGVERYSDGECKRGDGRARESEREKKLEGERESERDKKQGERTVRERERERGGGGKEDGRETDRGRDYARVG